MVALFAYGGGRVGKERDAAAAANGQQESVARKWLTCHSLHSSMSRPWRVTRLSSIMIRLRYPMIVSRSRSIVADRATGRMVTIRCSPSAIGE